MLDQEEAVLLGIEQMKNGALSFGTRAKKCNDLPARRLVRYTWAHGRRSESSEQCPRGSSESYICDSLGARYHIRPLAISLSQGWLQSKWL
jgi:hypothetical protein